MSFCLCLSLCLSVYVYVSLSLGPHNFLSGRMKSVSRERCGDYGLIGGCLGFAAGYGWRWDGGLWWVHHRCSEGLWESVLVEIWVVFSSRYHVAVTKDDCLGGRRCGGRLCRWTGVFWWFFIRGPFLLDSYYFLVHVGKAGRGRWVCSHSGGICGRIRRLGVLSLSIGCRGSKSSMCFRIWGILARQAGGQILAWCIDGCSAFSRRGWCWWFGCQW